MELVNRSYARLRNCAGGDCGTTECWQVELVEQVVWCGPSNRHQHSRHHEGRGGCAGVLCIGFVLALYGLCVCELGVHVLLHAVLDLTTA